jgi:hypothetical protein
MEPFREGDTFTTFSNLVNTIKAEILALENEYVLKASRSELEAYYVEKVMLDPLVLHSDQYYILSQSGTQIDVSYDSNRFVPRGEQVFVRGTELEIAIPFEGDPILWRVRASTFSLSGYPSIDVRSGIVVLKIAFPDDSAEPVALKSQIDHKIQSLQDAVANLRLDVDAHNSSAPQVIKGTLSSKIASAQATLGAVAALGIPVKRRDQPLTYAVPTIRRVSPIMPRVATEPYRSEPSLEQQEYEHILAVIRSMSLVIERTPTIFASLDEETIRNHFLIQLNGHYEGAATGETFNASGKTDILIRVENRNIFIAECKFWRGPKYFGEAIDQLLSYLAWRDTKCALLIFNKSKDTSAVKVKMHDLMRSRSEYKKTLLHDPVADSRYVLVKESDPGREIFVTTQVYDFPG